MGSLRFERQHRGEDALNRPGGPFSPGGRVNEPYELLAGID